MEYVLDDPDDLAGCVLEGYAPSQYALSGEVEAYECSAHDDDEGFATAKEEYAAYKRQVQRFVDISKEIEKLGKKCPRIDNTICRAEGVCQTDGSCKYDKEEETCGAATTAHCKQSVACKDEGKCTYDSEEGGCVESGP